MGNARRRFFSGPGMASLDGTVSRDFGFSEGKVLEFRAEAFKTFKPAQFFGASAVQGNERNVAAADATRASLPVLRVVMRVTEPHTNSRSLFGEDREEKENFRLW
jgi:hypothetical protein